MSKCMSAGNCVGSYCYVCTSGRVGHCYSCKNRGFTSYSYCSGYKNLNTPTTSGTCANCTNAVSADTEYQLGKCSGTTNTLECRPHSVCKPAEHLQGLTKKAAGNCTGTRPVCKEGEHLDGADAQNAGTCKKDVTCADEDEYKLRKTNFGPKKGYRYCSCSNSYRTLEEAQAK